MTVHLQGMMDKVPDGGPTGEQFGWNVNWFLVPLLENCRQTPTNEWLVPAEKILNSMFDKMSEGPDGYKGFVGPYIYNNEYWCDVHVSDAILCSHALAFAMIVQDKAELKAKYQKSYNRFIAIAKKDLIEKWHARGTFVEDGPFAGYHEWTMFCKPDDGRNWFEMKSARPNNAPMPSIPFNKALDMGHCMLQLYYLTGEESYKNRAEKIYNRFKAGMNRFDGGYTWNYWEPISPKDILETGPGHYDLTHWVGTHPYRDYQLGEIAKVMLAYDLGVTFTDDDMRRFVHTNLKFMWNGDRENPQWANSDSKLPGYKKAEPSTAYPTTAGTVWTPLARFDDTIRRLALQKAKTDDREFVPEINCERKYAKDAKVEDFPWMEGIVESGGQVEAIVIPSVVPPGENTMILSKSYLVKRSPVEIYVRPFHLAGTPAEMTLLTTQQMGDSVQMYYSWDGKIGGKRTPGEYVVVWKFLGGERAYPVTIK